MNKEISILKSTRGNSLNLSTLATQVFLDTYAVQGIRTELSVYAAEYLSAKAFKAKFDNPDIELYHIIKDNNFIGFAEVNFSSKCEADNSIVVEVDKLYVQQNFIGKGYGKKLLEYIGNKAKNKGYNKLWLSVYELNKRAVKFYEKNNFTEIGEFNFKLGNEQHRNIILMKVLA